MHTLSAYVEGIGLLGPGLTDWTSSQAVLCGREPYQPHKTVLPSPALLPAEPSESGKPSTGWEPEPLIF